ncbi:hypothetical protein MANES_06G036650v8, partial [Manihot esculenta]
MTTETALISSTSAALSSSSFSTMSILNVTQFLPIKLTSANYLLWNAQIMPLLHGYRLASHIDGTGSAPPELSSTGEINPAHADWFCQDQIVRSWINCSVTESIH